MKFVPTETYAENTQHDESDSEANTEFHLYFLDSLDQELEKNPLTEQ